MRLASLLGIASACVVADAHAATLWTELAPDAAGSAPPQTCSEPRLLAAVQLRVPAARTRSGDAPPEPGDLVATVGAAAGRWTLSVKGSDGLPLLTRPLPAPTADCVELLDAAALVVDRFLAEIHWSGRPSSPFVVQPPTPEKVPAIPWSGWLAVGPTLQAAVGAPVATPGLRLGFVLRHGRQQATLEAQAALPSRSQLASGEPDPGQIESRGGSARLGLGHRMLGTPLAVLLEAAGGAELAWFRASDPGLLQSTPATVVLPFLGVGAGLDLSLPRGFAVGLRCEGRVYLARAHLSVEGYSTSVDTRWYNGLVSLEISHAIF